ncbi:MAG: FAD-binding oxidoreductase [Pseudomonadota bacterium]
MTAPFPAALLSNALPAGIIDTDETLLSRHSADWSGKSYGAPSCLLRPKTTDELSRLLSVCNTHRIPVAVQGGLTGLCGAASTQPGEVALSLERMAGVESVLPGAMTVLAGTTVAAAQDAAQSSGQELGIDFGARGTATIGGAIATNAGGLRVIETGMTRAQVLGLEVVLADGQVLSELGTMVKVNSGFDLKQLFIGSEGLLGVVTRASLALRPLRPGLATAALQLASPAAAIDALSAARRLLGPDLAAFEVMWPDYVTTMSARTPFQFPFAEPLSAIIETRAADDETASERLSALLDAGLTEGWLTDAVPAQSLAQAKALWELRDEGPALYQQIFKDIVAFDVSVPLTALVETAGALSTTLPDGLLPLTYGHVGDQNLHFVAGSDRPLSADEKAAVERNVYDIVAEQGGAISAEHGIGMAKKPYLGLTRSPVAIALMANLKRTLDPHNILNPGRVIDL